MGFFFGHIDAAKQAFRQICNNPTYGLLNIIVFSLSLTLPLIFYLAIENLSKYTDSLTSEPQISIFLDLDANRTVVTELENSLTELPEVSNIIFIPKQKAMANLQKREDLQDFIMDIEGNPLPDAFLVSPRSTDPDRIKYFQEEIERLPGVESVQIDSNWINKVHTLVKLAKIIVWVLSIFLGTSVLVTTFNTIRLQILIQQEEIEVSKLIGATNGFIRRPFLYFGVTQGLLSALLAIVTTAGFLYVVNVNLEVFANFYDSELILNSLRSSQILFVVSFAVTLGWIGAWLSTTRHLKRLENT
ncbi:MAG: hypothetical protein CMK56_08645 [Proteobacteria bacterium]|nr:hypothetical protein [Pseudomonadota bacterium]